MDENKTCGDCVLFLHTYLGGECSLTDNSVDYTQPACIDFINEDTGGDAPEINYDNGKVKRHPKQNFKR